MRGREGRPAGSASWWERRRTPVREDPLAVFLRGLVIGAFVGAFVVGSAAVRRLVHR